MMYSCYFRILVKGDRQKRATIINIILSLLKRECRCLQFNNHCKETILPTGT